MKHSVTLLLMLGLALAPVCVQAQKKKSAATSNAPSNIKISGNKLNLSQGWLGAGLNYRGQTATRPLGFHLWGAYRLQHLGWAEATVTQSFFNLTEADPSLSDRKPLGLHGTVGINVQRSEKKKTLQFTSSTPTTNRRNMVTVNAKRLQYTALRLGYDRVKNDALQLKRGAFPLGMVNASYQQFRVGIGLGYLWNMIANTGEKQKQEVRQWQECYLDVMYVPNFGLEYTTDRMEQFHDKLHPLGYMIGYRYISMQRTGYALDISAGMPPGINSPYIMQRLRLQAKATYTISKSRRK